MIPKKIYQTWKTKNLSGKLADVVKKFQEVNPEYEYQLFDDKDCKDFIEQHFGKNYANAFDILIPGAFKADFWRYCVLYINGGVYLDIDMTPLAPLKQIIPNNTSFVSVVDKNNSNLVGIYQAFLACCPKHPIMKYSLEFSFANIAMRRMGEIYDTLTITGPGVVGVALNLYWNKENTNSSIQPGKYDDIMLYQLRGDYTWDGNKKLFQNKFSGYNGGSYRLETYYKDDPRLRRRRIIKIICIVIIGLMIIGFILSFVFIKKWKNCESTCN